MDYLLDFSFKQSLTSAFLAFVIKSAGFASACFRISVLFPFFENEQVQFRSVCRSPEVAVSLTKLTDKLLKRKTFPGRSCSSISQQIVKGIYLKEIMKDSGISDIYLGRFYQTFSCICKIWTQPSND